MPNQDPQFYSQFARLLERLAHRRTSITVSLDADAGWDGSIAIVVRPADVDMLDKDFRDLADLLEDGRHGPLLAGAVISAHLRDLTRCIGDCDAGAWRREAADKVAANFAGVLVREEGLVIAFHAAFLATFLDADLQRLASEGEQV